MEAASQRLNTQQSPDVEQAPSTLEQSPDVESRCWFNTCYQWIHNKYRELVGRRRAKVGDNVICIRLEKLELDEKDLFKCSKALVKLVLGSQPEFSHRGLRGSFDKPEPLYHFPVLDLEDMEETEGRELLSQGLKFECDEEARPELKVSFDVDDALFFEVGRLHPEDNLIRKTSYAKVLLSTNMPKASDAELERSHIAGPEGCDPKKKVYIAGPEGWDLKNKVVRVGDGNTPFFCSKDWWCTRFTGGCCKGDKVFSWEKNQFGVEGKGLEIYEWKVEEGVWKWKKSGTIYFSYKLQRRINNDVRHFAYAFALLPVIYPWFLWVLASIHQWFNIPPDKAFVHICPGFPRCEGSVVGASVSDFISEAPATGGMAATFMWTLFQLRIITAEIPQGWWQFLSFCCFFLIFLMSPVTKYPLFHAFVTLGFCVSGIAYFLRLLWLFKEVGQASPQGSPFAVQSCVRKYNVLMMLVRISIGALACVFLLQLFGMIFAIREWYPIAEDFPWLFWFCECVGLSSMSLFPVLWEFVMGERVPLDRVQVQDCPVESTDMNIEKDNVEFSLERVRAPTRLSHKTTVETIGNLRDIIKKLEESEKKSSELLTLFENKYGGGESQSSADFVDLTSETEAAG